MNIKSVIRPLLYASAIVGGSVCMAQHNDSQQIKYNKTCTSDVFTSGANQHKNSEKKVAQEIISWEDAINSEFGEDADYSNCLSTQAQTKAYSFEESNKVARQYVNNLQKDFGLTKAQAAAIVGNLWHESGGMNPGITQGGVIGKPNSNMEDDNENGYGIAQWGGLRKEELLEYAELNRIPVSSDAANYGFLKQELKGKYGYIIDDVKNTNSVEEATQTFEKLFERATAPQMDSRLALAYKLTGM